MLLPIVFSFLSFSAALPSVALAGQHPTPRAVQAAETLRKGPGNQKRKLSKVRPASNASASTIRSTTPVGLERLKADLASMIDRATHGGHWGVAVVSLSSGDTMFTRNADDQVLPASTMKLFTSAIALDRFGPEGRFETQAFRAGAIGSDGTLRGDIVLRGAGDPTLSGKATEGTAEAPMDALARQISDAGVKRVSGGIVADASAFEPRRIPEGWRTRYLHASYAARVSALSFNENLITVLIKPGAGRADISFEPPVSGIVLANEIKVVAGSAGSRIGIHEDSTGRLRLTGWIGSKSATRDYMTVVEHPELFAAGALRAALIARGVMVDGALRMGRTPDDAVMTASVASPPLEKIIMQMNGESNNHFAELLFRNAARETGVAGSAENGNTRLRQFLTDKAGIASPAVFAADGSGLSTLDRVTARAMVQLLGYARHAQWGSVLEQSLPVAGETETLRHRMRYTTAMGNLHAKTGTTNDVASLGGYVTAKNGEQLAFSFIYNGGDRWKAKEAMDAMGATLASFTR